MYRQARLSGVQEDQLTTWTEGKFDRDSVIKALRKLDKVREQAGTAKRGTYFGDEPGTEGTGDDEESDYDEEYVYLQQGDLQEVYDEAEVQQALATYQQVRKALQDQKNARKYYPFERPKGKGEGKTKSGGKQGVKVHISMLKLRTKCAKCGQTGHWAAECVNPPDGYRKPGGPATGATASQTGGPSSTGSKVGFYQASGDGGSTTFWEKRPTLGDFIRASRDTRCSREPGSERESAGASRETQVPHVIQTQPDLSFSGVTAQSHHGIVDSAAQDGVIGKVALERLKGELN